MKHLQSQRGFTLVEIIIVISLVGFLFVAIFGSFLQIQELMHDQNLNSTKHNQAMIAIQAFSDDINNLYYEVGNARSFFTGTEELVGGKQVDKLNFAVSSAYSNPSTLQGRVFSVTYFGETNDLTGKVNLYRKEDSFLDYANKENGIPIAIIENIEEFSLEYSSNNSQWKQEWNLRQVDRLPCYIRATFRWNENNNIKEFLLTITPMLEFIKSC